MPGSKFTIADDRRRGHPHPRYVRSPQHVTKPPQRLAAESLCRKFGEWHLGGTGTPTPVFWAGESTTRAASYGAGPRWPIVEPRCCSAAVPNWGCGAHHGISCCGCGVIGWPLGRMGTSLGTIWAEQLRAAADEGNCLAAIVRRRCKRSGNAGEVICAPFWERSISLSC